MKPKKDITAYSNTIDGERGNYNWRARFDWTNGFVGIDQFEGKHVNDRVLLSPMQAREFVRFVKECGLK